jgi:hypothetical protein
MHTASDHPTPSHDTHARATSCPASSARPGFPCCKPSGRVSQPPSPQAGAERFEQVEALLLPHFATITWDGAPRRALASPDWDAGCAGALEGRLPHRHRDHVRQSNLIRHQICSPLRLLVKHPAIPVSGDTPRLTASHASHRVPAPDRRDAGGYYTCYYTSRGNEGPLTRKGPTP